jgi:hypothetical protein
LWVIVQLIVVCIDERAKPAEGLSLCCYTGV